MRFLTTAVLTLVLAAAPAFGQSGRNYGSATCRPVVPCPADIDSSMLDGLITVANACVSERFGYISSDGSGFFDPSAGLDSNGCLTAKPGILPKGMGAQLAPSCCVIQADADGKVCKVHCNLNTVAPGH